MLAVDSEGDTVFLRRYPFEALYIAKASADSAIEARARFYERVSPEIATRMRKEARVPEMYRPVAGVVVGRDQTVWLRLHDRPEGRPYLALDPSGEPIGTFMLPRNTVISVVDRENVWMLEHDAYDIPSSVRYGIAADVRSDLAVH